MEERSTLAGLISGILSEVLDFSLQADTKIKTGGIWMGSCLMTETTKSWGRQPDVSLLTLMIITVFWQDLNTAIWIEKECDSIKTLTGKETLKTKGTAISCNTMQGRILFITSCSGPTILNMKMTSSFRQQHRSPERKTQSVN